MGQSDGSSFSGQGEAHDSTMKIGASSLIDDVIRRNFGGGLIGAAGIAANAGCFSNATHGGSEEGIDIGSDTLANIEQTWKEEKKRNQLVIIIMIIVRMRRAIPTLSKGSPESSAAGVEAAATPALAATAGT